jgi:N-acetylneuraminate synthase
MACRIIGEVAQAHDGSLGTAHAYIDAIARAGADAVKFQCHLAAAESTPDEPWRVPPEWPQDASRFDYWKRMEFTPEQWYGLKAHADEAGLLFLCSPFSVESVRLLDPLVGTWKLASGEVTNRPLLEAIAETAKPVIVSTGMMTMAELDEVLVWFPDHAILQCTSAYPCPPERVGLNVLRDFRRLYDCPVGLSDHSGTIYPSLAAVTLGCDILEVHVTLSREAFGFDVSSSVTTAELRQLVDGVRFIERAMIPVDKDATARELEPMRRLFMDRWRRRENA